MEINLHREELGFASSFLMKRHHIVRYPGTSCVPGYLPIELETKILINLLKQNLKIAEIV
jgi:hypothetical protein